MAQETQEPTPAQEQERPIRIIQPDGCGCSGPGEGKCKLTFPETNFPTAEEHGGPEYQRLLQENGGPFASKDDWLVG